MACVHIHKTLDIRIFYFKIKMQVKELVYFTRLSFYFKIKKQVKELVYFTRSKAFEASGRKHIKHCLNDVLQLILIQYAIKLKALPSKPAHDCVFDHQREPL